MSILALAKKRLSAPILHLLRPRLFPLSSTQKPDLKTPSFILRLHFFSSHSTQIPESKTSYFKMDDYLISAFGFSPAKAARISKPIAHLKSPQNPDAVRSFLKEEGFDETEIKSLITRRPNILVSSPKKTLEPNLRALRDIGLSTSALTQIILFDPRALQLSLAVPRIIFWRNFLAGDERALVRAFKQSRGLVSLDISGGISTKISFLQSHGISNDDIRRIVCRVPHFITSSLSSIEDLLNRVKELGFQVDSGMFVSSLDAIKSVSRVLLKKRIDLLKSYGWTEDEFLTALQKCPNMATLSEENLRAKMDFLLGEAKCNLSFVTFRPVLLTHSLEKRLRPRLGMLLLLESKDLFNRKEFFSAIHMADSKFVARYILPYKEEIPKLHELYLASCAAGSG